MTKHIASLLALSALCMSAPVLAQNNPLNTDTQKFSYVLGLDVGESLQRLDTKVDMHTLTQAIEDVLQNRPKALKPAEVKQVRKQLVKELRGKAQAKQQATAQKNLKAGEAFLAQNKQKPGVKETQSGLQYKVIKQGDGPKPKATDTVTVQYRGKLIDGTVFDSSYKHGKPATFELDKVIPGWTEGVQLMPVGSTYEFYLPAKLAYGKRGAGRVIGPDEALIFNVKLLKIDHKSK